MNSSNSVFVTVALPCYNATGTIESTILSVLNQTYTNFELIIVDDNSTDGTKEILDKYAKIDKRITCIYKERNTGYVDSLNLIIAKSKGGFIARIDADDICHQERLKRQTEYLILNPKVTVVGTFALILGTEKLIKAPTTYESIKLRMLQSNVIIHPSVMIKKSFLKESNLSYEKNYIPSEDYKLWVDLIIKGYIINVIPEPLIFYRTHNLQISNIRNVEQEDNASRVREKYWIYISNGLINFDPYRFLRLERENGGKRHVKKHIILAILSVYSILMYKLVQVFAAKRDIIFLRAIIDINYFVEFKRIIQKN